MHLHIKKRKEEKILVENYREEREAIIYRMKEQHRIKKLEAIIRQELIDSGELFGEQPRYDPIPRETIKPYTLVTLESVFIVAPSKSYISTM